MSPASWHTGAGCKAGLDTYGNKQYWVLGRNKDYRVRFCENTPDFLTEVTLC